MPFKPTYTQTHARTHDDKGYRDPALTAGGEVMDGSAHGGTAGVGMHQCRRRLSLSRTDRSYLYAPHLSPSALDTGKKIKGLLRDQRRR